MMELCVLAFLNIERKRDQVLIKEFYCLLRQG